MHASLKNQFIVCGNVVNNSITSDNCKITQLKGINCTLCSYK